MAKIKKAQQKEKSSERSEERILESQPSPLVGKSYRLYPEMIDKLEELAADLRQKDPTITASALVREAIYQMYMKD